MSKSKKIVYHVGDIVRILNPHLVHRVGYPKTINDYLDELNSNENTGKISLILPLFGLSTWSDIDVVEKIRRALAYGLLKKNNFGGRERTIHTQIESEYWNLEAKVISKRVVKTGIYVAGSGDEEGYDPSYLDQEKANVLLTIRPFGGNIWYSEDVEIEEVNVEKVESLDNLTNKLLESV